MLWHVRFNTNLSMSIEIINWILTIFCWQGVLQNATYTIHPQIRAATKLHLRISRRLSELGKPTAQTHKRSIIREPAKPSKLLLSTTQFFVCNSTRPGAPPTMQQPLCPLRDSLVWRVPCSSLASAIGSPDHMAQNIDPFGVGLSLML